MNRGYVQKARAAATEETATRVLASALDCFVAQYFDEVTLDKIAAGSGVTVQTVIRRFGSKEGIVRALVDSMSAGIEVQRLDAPVGDIPGLVRNLTDHYEQLGDLMMHLVRQELRVPAFAEATDRGKRMHAQWCQQVFAPWLADRKGVDRQRLLAQLITTCDLYSWYLLRRQRGLSRRQVELAIVELLDGILPDRPGEGRARPEVLQTKTPARAARMRS